jgi:hypothetical protein
MQKRHSSVCLANGALLFSGCSPFGVFAAAAAVIVVVVDRPCLEDWRAGTLIVH